MTIIIEKRLLQIAVFIAACVPVYAGLVGAYQGGMMFENDGTNADLSNHIRYMSGLLIGIGLCFWAMIPHCLYGTLFLRDDGCYFNRRAGAPIRHYHW